MPADMLTVELGNEFSFRASASALGLMDKNFQQRTETWGKTYSYLPSVFWVSPAVRIFSMVPVKVWVTKSQKRQQILNSQPIPSSFLHPLLLLTSSLLPLPPELSRLPPISLVRLVLCTPRQDQRYCLAHWVLPIGVQSGRVNAHPHVR